jgi:hypothetical protein
MWVLIVLDGFSSVLLANPSSDPRAFEPERLQALMGLNMAASWDAYYVGLVFWGLASAVCSYLWFQSGCIRRRWAVFGLVSSAWASACARVFLVNPTFGVAVNLYAFDTPLGVSR